LLIPRIAGVELDEDAGRRLGAAIKSARIAAGYRKRAPFARKLHIDDFTMAVAEWSRPNQQRAASAEMLEYITGEFGWPAGEWARVARGAEPPPRRPRSDLEPLNADERPRQPASRMLTPGEAAELLGLHRDKVVRLADAGALPVIRTLGGHRRFRAEDVERLLAARARGYTYRQFGRRA
jgi:excisionase family DNA binding protein